MCESGALYQKIWPVPSIAAPPPFFAFPYPGPFLGDGLLPRSPRHHRRYLRADGTPQAVRYSKAAPKASFYLPSSKGYYLNPQADP